MNRERTEKLLNPTGLAVLKRPDGGVVTQRTANPLPRADFRHSWHNSPSVPRIAFQGLNRPSANSCLIATFPIGRTEPSCSPVCGRLLLREIGGAKSGVGDGAVSSELKAPFRSQSMSPVVGEQRRIVCRTGAFKPWALTTPFAGTVNRERRASAGSPQGGDREYGLRSRRPGPEVMRPTLIALPGYGR